MNEYLNEESVLDDANFASLVATMEGYMEKM